MFHVCSRRSPILSGSQSLLDFIVGVVNRAAAGRQYEDFGNSRAGWSSITLPLSRAGGAAAIRRSSSPDDRPRSSVASIALCLGSSMCQGHGEHCRRDPCGTAFPLDAPATMIHGLRFVAGTEAAPLWASLILGLPAFPPRVHLRSPEFGIAGDERRCGRQKQRIVAMRLPGSPSFGTEFIPAGFVHDRLRRPSCFDGGESRFASSLFKGEIVARNPQNETLETGRASS